MQGLQSVWCKKRTSRRASCSAEIGDTNSVNSPTSSTSSIYYHALTVIEKNNLINQIDLVNSQVYGGKVITAQQRTNLADVGSLIGSLVNQYFVFVGTLYCIRGKSSFFY
jgi:hypothetical protein